ncbi:MAG TPA: 30S ribosomal protein S18 [Kiritimatiellia bacterium]|jgi:small subunit ribosomal protein S18|nr:MAG: 30S ribosomal protein S18 [Verrucomicrobia bacterium ADurb.Bin070]HPO37066.1 30S ribosomal protein S18 [Kiritimatiellia bacterium]HQL51293.1 30S ribosomal protein S18 [Kiritimatiellia bacterium]HQQ91991.1 30S ribosomal protein S18 [Kiritimatiellia bacterium]
MAMQKRNNRTDRDSRDRDMMPNRKRVRILDPNDVVDINDVEFLRRFVTEYGKIVPARLTGVTAAQQRQIKQGVRRARNMGLMA